MKYPDYADYLIFDRFHSKYVVDEPEEGSYVARPRGELGIEYHGTRSVPGIRIVTIDNGSAVTTQLFNVNRPVYLSSKADFGYKLMCGLMQKGLV
jgi:hypothetical protein